MFCQQREFRSILILDVRTDETPDPKPIDAAAISFDVRYRTIVSCYSSAIRNDRIFGATSANLPSSLTDAFAPNLESWLLRSLALNIDIGCAVAHDVSSLESFVDLSRFEIPLLCSMRDFNLFGDRYRGDRNLLELALEHGIGISLAHRAIHRALLLSEVFARRPNLADDLKLAFLKYNQTTHGN
jgi:hypothetical protein